MKIGLSFSRCVRDIVEGVVNIDDVLVVISRTDFDPRNDSHWKNVWLGYGGVSSEADPTLPGLGGNTEEWFGDTDEDQFRSVSIELWETGKLHQPRKFGCYPTKRPEFWLETCLPSSELARNPAAKAAWDHFQTVAGLTNVHLDTQYQ